MRPARSTDIVVSCPGDGSTLGHVANQTAEEVAYAAAELRKAQPHWQALGPRRRAHWLALWRDWFLDNQDHLLTLVQQESGKSWGDASIEILAAVESLNYFLEQGPLFLRGSRPKPVGVVNKLKRLSVEHFPYPLVGVITPWNYPLGMPMLDIPAALIAGCAVLSKPSEFTPLTWMAAVDGWSQIGAPPVLSVVTGLGDVGAAVIDEVDMVQFTGSVRTGREVGARAGRRLVPASLELGGKDAMIVLADADLERAANGAVWGGYFNAGQTCVSIERVYVEKPAYDEFIARLIPKVAALRVGMDEPASFSTDFGAMANASQLGIVEGHVAQAVAEGARVLTGGRRTGSGLFYEPTVLVDVNNSMTCMQEETFGPLLPVMAVEDAREAVRLTNDSEFGLSASIWTSDLDRAERLASELQVGAVNINSVMMNVFQFPLPHAGWKSSGVGYRSGASRGVLKYTRPQALVSDRYYAKSEVFWYPHRRRSGIIQRYVVRLLGARDWPRRLSISTGKIR
ncbi:aldehyde dehydrogenase [Mycolicibacterium mucogenicum]|uniref:Aldehyde dehydrogenase n=1 Tax=Mycolicibacterium mucogenicum TaxID=56689 RepID=A0A1A3H2H0_MYCMU|nr:aldehyde dehydrogenase family protein [Mycolicibacterium mucogenicum]OBJ42487.1 aldehyde dehydrogenase [Mycolicibacterium mucogenicum]